MKKENRELTLLCTLQDKNQGGGNLFLHVILTCFYNRISLSCFSVPLCFTNNGKNIEKDVDDVCVQVQRSKDVLLWTQGQLLVAEQQLCVHRQELLTRGSNIYYLATNSTVSGENISYRKRN